MSAVRPDMLAALQAKQAQAAKKAQDAAQKLQDKARKAAEAAEAKLIRDAKKTQEAEAKKQKAAIKAAEKAVRDSTKEYMKEVTYRAKLEKAQTTATVKAEEANQAYILFSQLANISPSSKQTMTAQTRALKLSSVAFDAIQKLQTIAVASTTPVSIDVPTLFLSPAGGVIPSLPSLPIMNPTPPSSSLVPIFSYGGSGSSVRSHSTTSTLTGPIL